MNKTEQTFPSNNADSRPLTILQVIQSVAWSFFGVQSQRNRERDFKQGNAWQFMAVGFAMTFVVVLIFLAAVQLALHFGNAAS